MSQEPLYIVRDTAGAIYGPANVGTLQQWIGEGRITRQMQVAPQGTQDFLPAADMPSLAGAFSSDTALAQTPAAVATTSQSPYGDAYRANTSYPTPYASVYPRSSGLAIGALVCGIASFPFFCAPCALAAVIMGHIARGMIRREPDRYEGQGMATAGLILGYICLSLVALVILLYVVVLIVVFGAVAAGGGR